MKNKIKQFFKILVVTAGCLMFASFSPSLDGRAVVVEDGVFPQGLFAKTVGYLPGDIISVTNIAGDTTIDLLVIGALDPSEGVAIMLSPEAADAMGIDRGANNIVKITKRSGQDERVYGNAVISKSAAEIEDFDDSNFENISAEENTDAFVEPEENETPEAELAIEPETLTDAEFEDEAETESEMEAEAEAEAEEPELDVEEEDFAEEDFDEAEAETETETETEIIPAETEEEEAFEDEEPLEEIENTGAEEEEALPEEEAESEEEFVDEAPEDNEEAAEAEAFEADELGELPEEEAAEEETDIEEDTADEEEAPVEETVDEEAFEDELPSPISEPENEENEVAEELPSEEDFDEEALDEESFEEAGPEELPVEEEAADEDIPASEAFEADELESLPADDEERSLDTDSEDGEYDAIVLVPVDSNPPQTDSDEVEDVISEYDIDSLEEITNITSNVERSTNTVTETNVSTVTNNISTETSYEKYMVPSLKDLESGKYYIQIAVYGSDENIMDVINKYGNNYPITIVPMASGKTKQVLVGPVTMDEYKVVLERFKSYGFKDAFLRKVR